MRQRRKRELFARDKLLPRHARSVSFLSNKKKGHGIRQSIFSVPFPKSLKAAFPIRMIVAAELQQQHLLQCETLPSADSIIWLWHSWVCDGEIPALPSGIQGASRVNLIFCSSFHIISLLSSKVNNQVELLCMLILKITITGEQHAHI